MERVGDNGDNKTELVKQVNDKWWINQCRESWLCCCSVIDILFTWLSLELYSILEMIEWENTQRRWFDLCWWPSNIKNMKHCKKMQMKKVFLTKHLKIDESHFGNRNIIEVVFIPILWRKMKKWRMMKILELLWLMSLSLEWVYYKQYCEWK